MAETTEPTAEEISRVMRHLNSLGASKGGHARAAKLSSRKRKQIARNAAKARWSKERKVEDQSSSSSSSSGSVKGSLD